MAPSDPDQSATPYADALRRHRDGLRGPFMIPGHSAGVWGSTDRLIDFMGAEAVALDIPQLLPGVDLEADSPYARSRELAAQAWRAERTWFLTNGASQGNRMALIAAAAFGDTIVAQRSSHSSFFDGLVVSGLTPRFVHPTIDPVHGIAHGVTAAQIDDALDRARDAGAKAAAVAIVSPSYFGAVADVAAIAEAAHRHGVLLIVDGSWGAHFGFHPGVPASPTQLGADIVISSVHKLGGSLTQTAMVHVTPTAPAGLASQLERAFRLTESTSPNSLLLASLDIARAELASNRMGLEVSLAAARRARELVAASSVLSLPDDDFLRHPDVIALDPLHVAVDVRGLGLTGAEAKARLGAEHGVFVEIASEHAVVALVGAGQGARPELLVDALEALASDSATDAAASPPAPRPPQPGEAVLTPREAYFAPSELVAADAAVGRVSTDLLAAYPPGVPNIVPGERITAEAVAFLHAVTRRPSGYVRGAVDPLVAHLRVVRETA
ncbi:MAG: aminotransferase class V-fold PLP-dependent enzyme [Cryobacterium sp.]|nr:aminotransferase class V-fold PLP-dependent enzyme [Cryobacterium sp.]